ncbi:MAG: GNAT family N-acetyltransferase [Acidimicrobiia bacterium]
MTPALPLPDPPLEDDVVLLRAWSAPDAATLAEAWSDHEVRRWTRVPEDCSLAAARHWIAADAARRERGLALDLVVERRVDGSAVGEVGLVCVDPGRGLAEAGWWTGAAFRRQGLAGRAVALLAGWALSELSVEQVFARLDPANVGSVGVARAAGFAPRGTASDGREVWSRRA